MDEQNQNDQNDRPGSGYDDQRRMDDTHPVFGQPTPPEDTTTRPLPPYNPAPQRPAQQPAQQSWFDQYAQPQPAQAATQTATRPPRSRGLAAAVLAGALVLGGAAGVGGAAAFNA